MAEKIESKEKKSFKDTLNLPKTDFPIRPNNKENDPKLIERWKKEDLFKLSFDHNKGNEKYILHDGPPYANGDIHLGHAYNKILKDIATKSRRMFGMHVPVTPGWDCHGLPIEQKVIQSNPDLINDKVELKKECRKYANYWIDIQRNSFKSLGVLMDWDNPYITMDPGYEASIIRAFGVLVLNDYVERKNKTVPWCYNCQTVLASAEIEHKNRKDPSIYVLFDLKSEDSRKLFNVDKPVSLVVWTTTPWTLPLNRAVLSKANADYVLLQLDDSFVILGEKVAEGILEKAGLEKKVVKNFKGSLIKDLKVRHPFIESHVPIIFDDSVSTEDGTAFVHCAPGCGPIDYEIGVKNNLEIFSPISSDGKYLKSIEPKDLENISVVDGQIWVIKKLKELGKLFYKTNINHSYPHCWRCYKGLIFRATPQWFFDLNKDNLKQKALKAIENIKFTPLNGRNFLKATVESRWEWCLSRQRSWGVPIPALICQDCDYGFLNTEIIEKVAQGVQREGVEFWDRISIENLASGIQCPKCQSSTLEKEKDILDVWFDAGVSHYAVLLKNKELSFPADLYLEGIDQHRGWFQSSLLTSLVLEKEPAMKEIMTHGYTVDAKGQKMSKSLGNVILPKDITNKLGTDGLRLWAASIGYDSDPIVSDALLENVSQVYRKIRNSCRFLLSNLYDFDIQKDGIAVKNLLPIDYYALTQLELLNSEVLKYYLEKDYTAIFHALADYTAVELSSFYLDIVKDRLYCEKSDGHKRRSAQTVLWYILDVMTRLMAPIMSFASELISDHYQENKSKSIHLQNFVDPKDLHELCYPKSKTVFLPGFTKEKGGILQDLQDDLKNHLKPYSHSLQWELLREVRSLILKAIEEKRENGEIKHSLEAQVELFIDLSLEKYNLLKELFELLKKDSINLETFLKELLIVSSIKLFDQKNDSKTGVSVRVSKAEGQKCPRCWQWDRSKYQDDLCRRCESVLV